MGLGARRAQGGIPSDIYLDPLKVSQELRVSTGPSAKWDNSLIPSVCCILSLVIRVLCHFTWSSLRPPHSLFPALTYIPAQLAGGTKLFIRSLLCFPSLCLGHYNSLTLQSRPKNSHHSSFPSPAHQVTRSTILPSISLTYMPCSPSVLLSSGPHSPSSEPLHCFLAGPLVSICSPSISFFLLSPSRPLQHTSAQFLKSFSSSLLLQDQGLRW